MLQTTSFFRQQSSSLSPCTLANRYMPVLVTVNSTQHRKGFCMPTVVHAVQPSNTLRHCCTPICCLCCAAKQHFKACLHTHALCMLCCAARHAFRRVCSAMCYMYCAAKLWYKQVNGCVRVTHCCSAKPHEECEYTHALGMLCNQISVCSTRRV